MDTETIREKSFCRSEGKDSDKKENSIVTYQDIVEGCTGFLDHLKKENIVG